MKGEQLKMTATNLKQSATGRSKRVKTQDQRPSLEGVEGVKWEPLKTKFKKRLTVDGVSYQQWVDAFLTTLEEPPKAGGELEIGNEFVMKCKVFPTHKKRATGYFGLGPMGWSRCRLSTFQGSTRGEVYFTTDVTVPVIQRGRTIWMSLTPMEVMSQRGAVKRSHGNVLIGGLGMGWCAREVLNRKRVTSVTVVDREPTILSYFGEPLFRDFGRKFKWACNDFYKFAESTDISKYDTVLVDIWPDGIGRDCDNRFQKLKEQHDNIHGWGISTGRYSSW